MSLVIRKGVVATVVPELTRPPLSYHQRGLWSYKRGGRYCGLGAHATTPFISPARSLVIRKGGPYCGPGAHATTPFISPARSLVIRKGWSLLWSRSSLDHPFCMTSDVSGHTKGVVSTIRASRSERSERSPHHNYIESVPSCVTHSDLFSAVQMRTRKRPETDSNEKTCTHNGFECE